MSVQEIPLSARFGDNITEPSARMTWFEGPTFLGPSMLSMFRTTLGNGHFVSRCNGSIARMATSAASRGLSFRAQSRLATRCWWRVRLVVHG